MLNVEYNQTGKTFCDFTYKKFVKDFIDELKNDDNFEVDIRTSTDKFIFELIRYIKEGRINPRLIRFTVGEHNFRFDEYTNTEEMDRFYEIINRYREQNEAK